MKKRSIAFLVALCSTPTFAATTLTSGTGEGTVTVTVGDSGEFGSRSNTGSDAVYDPVGSTAAAGTVFQSFVYLGFAGLPRTNISQTDATVSTSSSTGVTSTFASSGLDFTLVQQLSNLIVNGAQAGSLLTQTYSFTNTGPESLTFDLVRYLDGDLTFNGDINADGGGRFINTMGQEILFETDTAIGTNDSDTFLGILNDGGTSSAYEINSYFGLLGRIAAGQALGNTVLNDGPDADQFIDANQGYDVTLGLGRTFTVAAGGTGTFITRTIFGTGTPSAIVIPDPTTEVPEPATWAMMLAGFGAIGATMRRRRTAIRFA